MLGLQIVLLSPLRPYGEQKLTAHIYLLLQSLYVWLSLGKKQATLCSLSQACNTSPSE